MYLHTVQIIRIVQMNYYENKYKFTATIAWFIASLSTDFYNLMYRM